MDLIVELLPSAPTLSAPADQQIEIDSAGSTTVSYSYTITTKANGSDIYDLTAALITTNLSGSPVAIFQQGAVPITSVTLGATAAVANSPAGAKSIPVPTDGTVDDLVNGIQAGDSILVHGINHKVSSVTDNGVTARISLTPAHDSEVLAGDLITESQTFELLISDISIDDRASPATIEIAVSATSQSNSTLVTSNTYTWTHEGGLLLPGIVHNQVECREQGKNFGEVTVGQCLKRAAENPSVCAPAAMFSNTYPSWGCRCCAANTADNLPGASHNLWDIFALSTQPMNDLKAAMVTAEQACQGTGTPEKALAAAKTINQFARQLGDADVRTAVQKSGAPATAAAILAAGCTGTPSGSCGIPYGAALKHNLRLLVLLDSSDIKTAATQAYPTTAEEGRRRLLAEHRVLLGDADVFTDKSINAIHLLFDNLPPHLMEEGVTKDARFAILTREDRFKCGKNDTINLDAVLGATPRGFNVFDEDVGDVSENAFDMTGLSTYADRLMTVVRHEGAHQFDRVARAEDGGSLMARRDALAAESVVDKDWLRTGSAETLRTAPQEIIASQVGNQYLSNSGLQLQLALSRIKDHPTNLGWFLFNVDLMADRPDGCDSYKCTSAVRLYKETPEGSGLNETSCASLKRDTSGRVTKLSRFGKGCGSYTFAYKGSSMTPVSYTNEGHPGVASACMSEGVLSSDRTTCSVPSDTTPPTIALSSGEVADGGTHDAAVTMTFTSSEETGTFTESDITVTNGTLSSFSGSGTTYTATITPDADGTVSVFVNADTFADWYGNNNTTSNTYSWTHDSTPPVITNISLDSSNTTLTVTFDEPAYSTAGSSGTLEADDFQIFLTPGTAALASTPITKVETVDDINFKLTLALVGPPSGNETLSILPAENAIYDKAGNPASTSSSLHSNYYIDLNPDTTPKPDLALQVSGASFSPTTVSQGDTVALTLTVLNKGNAPSPDHLKVRAHLYGYSGSSWRYVLLGETTVNQVVQPGASISVSFNGQILAHQLPYNYYYVTFTVDPDQQIDEQNESNNWTYIPAGSGRPTYLKVVSTPNPDLDLQSASFSPTTVSQGGTVGLSVQVLNIGNAPSPDRLTLRAALFPYGSRSANDYVPLGETTINQVLQPGDSISVSFNGQIPDDQKPYNYYVRFWVDPDQQIDEQNEWNNRHYIPTASGSGRPTFLKVAPTPKPDLALSVSGASFSPTTVRQGGTVNLTLWVWNTGNAPSPDNLTVRADLQPKDSIDDKDQVLLGETTANQVVQPWSTISVSFKGQIPDDQKLQDYYVRFWVDPDQQINERTESNNRIQVPNFGGTYLTVTPLDTTPPTSNSISINSGASYTNSTSVVLTLSSSGASQMRFRNESDGTWSPYEAYASSKTWTLANTEGTNTIYVQFKDNVGNAASAVSDTIDFPTTCSGSEYESQPPTASSDRVCATISNCGAGEYESAAPTATSDRFCSACTTCSGNEYVTLACSDGNGTNNRQCAPVTACSASEYQIATPTITSDRVCATISNCGAGEYESAAPTATSDRQCAPVTACSGSEYESQPPTASSDRVCATISNC
ncbi:MAG: CARDB domain-containing protein, partial [Acidobacteriota bacterium]|nr:CARDB domain-containing protein [Acidobacteriota bacterium]